MKWYGNDDIDLPSLYHELHVPLSMAKCFKSHGSEFKEAIVTWLTLDDMVMVIHDHFQRQGRVPSLLKGYYLESH